MRMRAAWLVCGLFLVSAFVCGACSEGEPSAMPCVTSFDCPEGQTCDPNSHQCVEAGADTTPVTDDGGQVFDDGEPTADDAPTLPEEETEQENEPGEPDESVVPVDEEEPVSDDAEEPVADDAALPVDDGTADVSPDLDVVADTQPDSDVQPDPDVQSDPDVAPDADTATANPGAVCSDDSNCYGGTVCAEVFVDQITSYCHYNCAAPNQTICTGTSWPDCSVVGSYAICLDIATIVGNFTAKVDSFQTGNNVNLTIAGTSNIQQACVAGKNTAQNTWVLQCSRIIQAGPPKIQLDALFFWPIASHAAGTVSGAEGQVMEATYDASNNLIGNWMRAFFLDTDGTLTLTQAGTTTGSTVAGSLNFTGNAYNAQFAP